MCCVDAADEIDRAAICANDIVTIILDPDRLQYMVHGALLSEESRYFKKALTRPSKGAEDRVVRLREVGSDYRETCKQTIMKYIEDSIADTYS